MTETVESDQHEPEILPKESWLNRDDPRFGEIVDVDDGPSSLREWASISAKLTKDALLELIREEESVMVNSTVMQAYDHRSKAFELVEASELNLTKNGHSFVYPEADE